MRDWTYSFIRNASMLTREPEELDMPPPNEPNTTILKFHHFPGHYTTVIHADECVEEITEATTEGIALLEFLLTLEREPGHDYTMWGRARELEDCIFIFIGWKERPSLPFMSSESLNQISETSPPRTLLAYLRTPLVIMNVAFGPSISPRISGPKSFVSELMTWVIPANLDPAYHQEPARQFDDMGAYIFRTECMTTARRLRDLAACYRGWIIHPETETNVATEPNEKSHVFLFAWRSAEAEARCKTVEFLGEDWEKGFQAVQEEWERMGLRSQSLHLKLTDFRDQLEERDWRARAASMAKS